MHIDFNVFVPNQQKTAKLSPIPNRCKKKNIMLIKNLFSLFGGSYQTGRSDNALPNVIEEKESIVIILEKFKDDIERPICDHPKSGRFLVAKGRTV